MTIFLTGLFVASFEVLSASLSHPPGTLYSNERQQRQPAPLAVVLGSNLASDTELGRRSSARLETAVSLYLEGRVSRLHFSGASRGPISVAAVMRDYAVARGVPSEAISIETRSQTTLQNASFTLSELGSLPPGTILLTDGAHLPRAWASFVWAGSGTDLVLVPSDPQRDVTFGRQISFIAREALAIWYNFCRIGVLAGLRLVGIDVDSTQLSGRLPLSWRPPT